MDWLDSIPESPSLDTEDQHCWPWPSDLLPQSPSFSSDNKLLSWQYTPPPSPPIDLEKFCSLPDLLPSDSETENHQSSSSCILSEPSSSSSPIKKWTSHENKIFENALAEVDLEASDKFKKIASRLPGRNSGEVKQRYESLTKDIEDIESGRVPLPEYPTEEGSPSREEPEKKRGSKWSEEEHRLFLKGIQKYGKGAWKEISRHFVRTRTAMQVASHAQKFYLHEEKLKSNRKVRSSIHDVGDTSRSTCRIAATIVANLTSLAKMSRTKTKWKPIAPAPSVPSMNGQYPCIYTFPILNMPYPITPSQNLNRFPLTTEATFSPSLPSMPKPSNDLNRFPLKEATFPSSSSNMPKATLPSSSNMPSLNRFPLKEAAFLPSSTNMPSLNRFPVTEATFSSSSNMPSLNRFPVTEATFPSSSDLNRFSLTKATFPSSSNMPSSSNLNGFSLMETTFSSSSHLKGFPSMEATFPGSDMPSPSNMSSISHRGIPSLSNSGQPSNMSKTHDISSLSISSSQPSNMSSNRHEGISSLPIPSGQSFNMLSNNHGGISSFSISSGQSFNMSSNSHGGNSSFFISSGQQFNMSSNSHGGISSFSFPYGQPFNMSSNTHGDISSFSTPFGEPDWSYNLNDNHMRMNYLSNMQNNSCYTSNATA